MILLERAASAGAVDAIITYSVIPDRCNEPGVYEPTNRQRTPTVWFEDRTVRILDGRTTTASMDIDRNGFLFAHLHTDAWDDSSERPNLKAYASQLHELIRSSTGFAESFVLSIVRRGENREPLLFAHNDFNFDHGPQRAREVMGPRSGELAHRRYVILQSWQPVGTPIDRHPLAFCDASTVRPGDLIPERGTFMISYNPEHRWYYFPRMRPDEIVLFKTYDSATDGRSRIAPHGSFNHPDTLKDAVPRQSVESRWLLLFE